MRQMLLVPAHQFPFRDSNVEKALELDREMKNILQRTDLPEFDKAQMYSQALHKYLTLRNEIITSTPAASVTTTAAQTDARTAGTKAVQTDSLPIGVVQTGTRPDNVTRSSPDTKASARASPDLSSISVAYRPKARQLLKYINESKSLAWDPKHQLKVRGKVIKGTDITALIREAVESSPSRNKPSNIKLFIKELADTNIPADLLGKVTYRNTLLRNLTANPSPPRTRAKGKENVPPLEWSGFDR